MGRYLVIYFFLSLNLFAIDDAAIIEIFSSIELSDGTKISLRYSKIDEVLNTLGDPDLDDFYEKGYEGFYWYNYYIYQYFNGKLIITFDSISRDIISIGVEISDFNDITLPFEINADSNICYLYQHLSEFDEITDLFKYDETILYYLNTSDKNRISGNIAFYENKIMYYIYYELPWND